MCRVYFINSTANKIKNNTKINIFISKFKIILQKKKKSISLATDSLMPPKDGYAVAFPLISKTASLWPDTMVWKKCSCHIFTWMKNVTVASDITFLTFKMDYHYHILHVIFLKKQLLLSIELYLYFAKRW